MVYFLAIVVVAMDQISKYLIKTYMQVHESIPLLGDVLRLTSHRNPGAAFGMLQGKRWLFVAISIAVILVISMAARKMGRSRKILSVALGLLMGGAVGNLIDRVVYGSVIDFIDIRIINYPIFNIADSAIVTAVVLMILDMLMTWRKEQTVQR